MRLIVIHNAFLLLATKVNAPAVKLAHFFLIIIGEKIKIL